jgi:hypothetical protein
MNKTLIALVLLVASTISATAFADGGAQDFTLYNESKLSIDALYISEANKDSWEEDVLGMEILEDGKSTPINFENTAECMWDIKIVQTGDGTAWIVPDINLCETTDVTFMWDEEAKAVVYKQGKVE